MHLITAFAGMDLPIYDPEYPITAGRAIDGVVRLPDGRFHDRLGSAQAEIGLPFDLPVRVTAAEENAATFVATISALLAKTGDLDRLWRVRDDGALQWCAARLLEVGGVRRSEDIFRLECKLAFEQRSPWWGETLHELGDTFYASEEILINWQNEGDRPVRNAILTLTAGPDVAVTGLELVGLGAGVAWTWAGVVALNTDWVMDCGAESILNNGADAWDGLTLGAGHVSPFWLPLAAGDNAYVVRLTGGSAASGVTLRYYDRWA